MSISVRSSVNRQHRVAYVVNLCEFNNWQRVVIRRSIVTIPGTL